MRPAMMTAVVGAILCVVGCGSDGTGAGGWAGAGGSGGAAGEGGTGGMAGGGGTGGTMSAACPQSFEIEGFGWGGPEGTDISQFSSIALELIFTNDVDGELNVAEFLAFSPPNFDEIPVSDSNLPIPVVGQGTQFTVTVTLDLTGLSANDMRLQFELADDTIWGNLRNDRLTLDSTEMVTCTP